MKAGQLMLSRDRKVSPLGWQQTGGMRPGRWVPTVTNSFGLPSHVTCPGETPFCESCYATGSENSAGVLQGLQRNHALLLEAGTVANMAELLEQMVAKFMRQVERHEVPAVFRIHWDGDFFSVDYADAWQLVMRAHPEVHFWAYTRSFGPPVNVLPSLAWLPNLSLYLSIDRWNVELAAEALERWPVLAAVCEEDYRSARELHSRLMSRESRVVCPENMGRVELMTDGVGACITCGVCVEGRQDVLFSTSHREDVAVQIRSGRGAGSVECAHPDCTEQFFTGGGRGRRRVYCSRACQLRHYTMKRRTA